jgi:phage-related protein
MRTAMRRAFGDEGESPPRAVQRVRAHFTLDGFGKGLFEIRTGFDGNIYRVLFCLKRSTLVLVHSFQKKSQKTPKTDLDLARQRMQQVE